MNTSENRVPILRIAILVAIACVVAGVVWFAASGSDDSTAENPAPDSSSTTAAASEGGSSSEHLAPETAPKGGVVLPEGESQADGYPVKFPYSDLGAVAADVEVAKNQIGFDYDQAATIAGVYAAPEERDVFEQRSQDAVALARKQAGVPAQGDVPPPASYAVTPIAFTVEELDTDYYVVNLLSYVTLTTADGKSSDNLYAGTQLLRWIDGDWKLVRGTEAELQQLINEGQPQAAAPGTPEYEKAGWIALNGEPQ